MGGLKAFLLSQSVDDVGILCVKLEVWLGASVMVTIADLVLAIAFAGCEHAWFNEILVALVWLGVLAGSLVLPLQRRTRAMPFFAIGTAVFAVLTLAWQIYTIVMLAQGKVTTGGGKACLAIIFVLWICRFATVGFAIYFAQQAVRAVPNNRSRNSVIVDDNGEARAAPTTGAYIPPQIPAEPSVTL